MDKRPVWLKSVVTLLVNLVTNSQAEGIKKLKPLLLMVMSCLITIVFWIIDPELLNQILKFLVSLI